VKYKVKIKTGKTILLFCWLVMIAAVQRVNAFQIGVVISSDIYVYKQAVQGIKQELAADIREYELHGDEQEGRRIMQAILLWKPDVVLTIGPLATVMANSYLKEIPVVFCMVLNPEQKGLKGGKIGGISMNIEADEQLKLIKRTLPQAKKVGVLYSSASDKTIKAAQRAAKKMKIDLIALRVEERQEVPDKLKELISQMDVFWMLPDNLVIDRESFKFIMLTTLENQIPVLGYSKNIAKAGALFSLAVNSEAVGRQAARLVINIIKKNQPQFDIFFPEEIEYALNLHIAQTMGLQIPPQVLDSINYVYK
jgi:putative ABC transport system substrate-binding protein